MAGAEVSPPLDGPLDVDVAVVGGGYTGLWTALAAARARPLALRGAARGTRDRRRAERPERWLPARLLVVAGRRSARCSGTVRALQLAHASSRIIPAVRAFARARGEDVWLREAGLLKCGRGATEDAAVERSVERRARARSRGGGASRSTQPRRAPVRRLAAVPQRRPLPRRRDRPAGATRARAAAGGASPRASGSSSERR